MRLNERTGHGNRISHDRQLKSWSSQFFIKVKRKKERYYNKNTLQVPTNKGFYFRDEDKF